MKRNVLYIGLLVGLLTLSPNLYAQDSNTDNHTIGVTVPEVALLDIEPAASKNITMGFTAPTEAGLPITAPADNSDLWLNVSSIVTATGGIDPSRKVSVKVDATIPGVDINVTAAADAGNGAGTTGTVSPTAITLTTANQDIVTGIGSCYTGTGANNGYNLTYSIDAQTSTNYGNIVANSNTVTVTHTISDN